MTDTQVVCKSGYPIEHDGWSFEPIHGDRNYWSGVFDRFPRKHELSHRDAEEIYNALAFMNWKSGITANVFLTINWAELGVPQSLVNKRLGNYLNELQKWLAGGTQIYRRRGSGPRPRVELHYVWVHEADLKRGLHSHILLHIPRDLFPHFRAWTFVHMERHYSGPLPLKSVKAKLGYGKNDSERVGQQWIWFKYMIKQLSPHTYFIIASGARNSREFFNPWRYRPTAPIAPMKMFGASRNIKETARKRASFVSYAQRRHLPLPLYEGHELREGRPIIKGLVVDSSFCFPGAYDRSTRRRAKRKSS